ncbi:TRAP transporter substrate-binding protein [Pseudooceanicola sp. CBS1P-1]|uniref:C4-dicarboxylate ABC transporter substrate-binding protein n=1 Tax=Pseudooceanicola albus TaxID=2692189 RepID=A0A6L7FZW8_9RHOB|nr:MULTISPECIES: TRAP transporter substrate-binding protein [Pseudooceanicola]MBT9382245.1 TRAP transporter substrate-binding protein [Pseudooceanicola endophyticus]MXN16788.1 C4-dicarboxylate ABC transporter substrate-binding protein [Pseudooceanicola albus]
MKTVTAASALVISGLLSGPALAETWDMPMAYPASNYHTENAQIFADAVKACTGGALEITIHANGSLFKGDEIKRAVQLGEAPIGERLLSAHANENPLFAYDSVPFLATSFEASEKLAEAAAPVLAKLLATQNLTLLYSVPWPPQGLYFSKPVETPEDMKGVKFRAYNATTAKVAELTGMVPTQIEAADLKQALATGVVSAMISSGSTGVDESVWEDMTNFYDVKAWLPRNTVFVNTDAFNALSDAEKTCLTDEAAKAQTRGAEKAEELAGGFVKTLADNGMTVGAPSAAISAKLEEVGKTMTADWLKATGDDGKAIVDAYEAQ